MPAPRVSKSPAAPRDLETRYRDLLRRHDELNARLDEGSEGLDAFRLARWTLRTTSAGYSLVRGGRLCATTQAFDAFEAPRDGQVRWRVVAVPGDSRRPQLGRLSTLVTASAQALVSDTASRKEAIRLARGNTIVDVSLDEIRFANGEHAVVVGVREVTALARAEAEALTAREKLMQQERLRAVGELACGIAHDVNNMLTALRLRLGVVEQDPTCLRRQRGNLGAIQEIVRQGSALVSKLQRVGRPEPSSRLTPVRIEDVVRAAVQLAESSLRVERVGMGKNLRIVTRVPSELPPVFGYADDLPHVLLNLLLNARDAMPAGGTIRVAAASRGGSVVLRVEDEGPGIPAPILPRVFDAYFTTKGEAGTGMGLAMARNVMERSGGSISARNRAARGACFELRFVPWEAPIGAAPRAVSPRPRARQRSSAE